MLLDLAESKNQYDIYSLLSQLNTSNQQFNNINKTAPQFQHSIVINQQQSKQYPKIQLPPMSTCGCCPTSCTTCHCCSNISTKRIQQKCPNHPLNNLDHFCTHHQCLQILCSQCLKLHKKAHEQLKIQTINICNLIDVENYIAVKINQQIKYEQKKAELKKIQNIQDPCSTICQMIDAHFSGSIQSKVANLNTQKQSLNTITAKKLVILIQRSSQYCIQPDFKQKYFKFLDNMLGLPPN